MENTHRCKNCHTVHEGQTGTKPSKHFWVLQTFDWKCLAKVKEMMDMKTIYNKMFLKRFMYTVY